MTAIPSTVTVPTRLHPLAALTDAWIMTKRNLLRLPRMPELIFFAAIQPIMFVLLFAYVFGNSIQLPGFPYSYRQFLMAGIFVQTIVFGSVATTGIGIAEDLQKGLIDRFRSLPMTRSSLMVGRTVSDIARNAFTTLILLGVGFAIGFRFHGGVLEGIAAVLLALLFGFAFSWVATCIGLLVRTPEAAQTGGFVWLFPLTFASSAFVSTENMPSWLRSFANVNPVTVTVDALRGLFDGTPVGNNVWQSVVWSVGVIAVFVPLSVLIYRRTITR